jgi:perosamine synthetase
VTWRQHPPVHSPVSARALFDGMGAAIGFRPDFSAAVAAMLSRRYGAVDALLTDSGKSALILTLKKLLPKGGTIAYPAYSCIDLTTAALGAGVHVRLYDLDPSTLSPDLDSLRATIKRGVDVIVLAHLYGYPADVRSAQALAAEGGIPIIEDAAQGAGGKLHGELLGSLGDVAVLSFGRGKGTTGGSGGAVLVRTAVMADWIRQARTDLKAGSRGGADMLSLAAQGLLSRPSLYRIPASIPSLKLGEMVYHAPRLPRAMSTSSAGVLSRTMGLQERDVSERRRRALVLLASLRETRDVTPISPISGGESGFLRLALLDSIGTRIPDNSLGAQRGYPMTLDQHPQLWPVLLSGERAGKGSRFLRDRLFTVPTHARVNRADLSRLARWLEGKSAARNGTATP